MPIEKNSVTGCSVNVCTFEGALIAPASTRTSFIKEVNFRLVTDRCKFIDTVYYSYWGDNTNVNIMDWSCECVSLNSIIIHDVYNCVLCSIIIDSSRQLILQLYTCYYAFFSCVTLVGYITITYVLYSLCSVNNIIRGGGGGGGSGKGLTFESPYFCQYLSELYQIFSSCVICGYGINFKISFHLHNLCHDYPEFHADQACFHGKASFEKITRDLEFRLSAIVLYTLSGAMSISDFFKNC